MPDFIQTKILSQSKVLPSSKFHPEEGVQTLMALDALCHQPHRRLS